MTKKRVIKYRILYSLYCIFNFIFAVTPKPIIKRILELFAFLIYKLDRKRYKTALANLNLVFKETKSDTEKKSIIYESYKTLAFNIYELLENQNLDKEKIFSKAKIINTDVIQNALNEKRKIIFITAHYGGWELVLPCIALKFNMKVGVVSKKIQNIYIQEKFAQMRAKNNITLIDKKNAAKGMIKTLTNDDKVAIVIDQYIDGGCDVNFLGIKDTATDATSRLALKFNALIIPIFATKNDFRKYEITICNPIDVMKFKFKAQDKVRELTQLQNDIMTEQILKEPKYWLWQHKRFRKNHSEIYN